MRCCTKCIWCSEFYGLWSIENSWAVVCTKCNTCNFARIAVTSDVEFFSLSLLVAPVSHWMYGVCSLRRIHAVHIKSASTCCRKKIRAYADGILKFSPTRSRQFLIRDSIFFSLVFSLNWRTLYGMVSAVLKMHLPTNPYICILMYNEWGTNVRPWKWCRRLCKACNLIS